MIKLKPRPLTKNEISQENAISQHIYRTIMLNRGKFNMVALEALSGECNTRITNFAQQTKIGTQIKSKV